MDVFVLGHRGMLGHVVCRYLSEQGIRVVTSDERYTAAAVDPLVGTVRESECPWVVNAIGLIKQKSVDAAALMRINAQLPAQLKAQLKPFQRIIHPSTDCVFSGKSGGYGRKDHCDATDDYGFSKLLGEAPAELGRFQVFRTSIIGPELSRGHGLMGWFLRQTTEVKGFVNHRWNGITTLEWAKLCGEYIAGRLVPADEVVQFGTTSAVSKFELLQMVRGRWEHPINIVPVNAPDSIDRTLVPDLQCKPIDQQLRELREWVGDPPSLQ